MNELKNETQALVEKAFLSAKRAFIRIPIFVQGNDAFVLSLLKEIELINFVGNEQLNERLVHRSIKWRNAKQWLGQELESIFFDVREEFDIEKLCALAGCVRGGHLIFFWLPDNVNHSLSYFKQRLYRFITEPACGFISSSGKNQFPALGECRAYKSLLPTEDQMIAISSIEKVLYGHRRRPVFIIADRGRGKSAALGLAAGKIMMASKKRILITSPIFSNVATLFKHAALACQLENKSHSFSLSNGSAITFIAPDKLLLEKPKCDLLLIDEAAAIPQPMLNQIMTSYSRIVFSSTEHGYEGTGRGFSTNFRNLLNEKNQTWREVKLHQPIRFAANCPFERWLYDVFLFDVEPVEPVEPSGRGVDFSQISQEQLVHDESLLKQLFALLINAHYQTSPNDLLQLLDGEKSLLIGAFVSGILVGILYAQIEGAFDQTLMEAIFDGKRRIKGHLLPQSLAQHTGIKDMLSLPMLRIIRLAVLPSWQRKGIAAKMIIYAESFCKRSSVHFLGASFSADSHLIQFWLKQKFSPLRLGVKKDAASGNYSLQVVKSLIAPPDWLNDLQHIFIQNFRYQVSDLYKDMPIEASFLLFTNSLQSSQLPKSTLLQVQGFASDRLGYDLVGGSLYAWYCNWLITHKTSSFDCDKLEEKLLFARLVQRCSWKELSEKYEFLGRKEIEHQMKLWVRKQLENKRNLKL